jgi:uncharacterized membrane protein YeaQ/YmgE (transglycosylase-associated protein family)
VGGLLGWLVGWLVGWLAGWLVSKDDYRHIAINYTSKHILRIKSLYRL